MTYKGRTRTFRYRQFATNRGFAYNDTRTTLDKMIRDRRWGIKRSNSPRSDRFTYTKGYMYIIRFSNGEDEIYRLDYFDNFDNDEPLLQIGGL